MTAKLDTPEELSLLYFSYAMAIYFHADSMGKNATDFSYRQALYYSLDHLNQNREQKIPPARLWKYVNDFYLNFCDVTKRFPYFITNRTSSFFEGASSSTTSAPTGSAENPRYRF